jgi:hypothetical protein
MTRTSIESEFSSLAGFRETSLEADRSVALGIENAVTCNHELNLEASRVSGDWLYIRLLRMLASLGILGIEEIFFESIFGFLALSLKFFKELFHPLR